MMIMGFDKAVAEMAVGDVVNVHLNPEEAYGEYDPNQLIKIEIAQLPGISGHADVNGLLAWAKNISGVK